MTRILLSILLFLFVALTACQSKDEAAAGNAGALHGRTWVFEKMRNWAGSSEAVFEPEQPNIVFEPGRELTSGNRVTGFSGVNRFFGSYTAGPGDKLKISQLGSTRMAGPPQAMEFERKFIDALRKARSFEIDGPKLVLVSQVDQLHFVAR